MDWRGLLRGASSGCSGTCNTWHGRARHPFGSAGDRAVRLPLVLASLCCRGVDGIVRNGFRAPQTTCAWLRSRVCLGAFRSPHSCRLAHLHRVRPTSRSVSGFWDCRAMDLPTCTVLDRSSATKAGAQPLVVPAGGRPQLHSLCFCSRFFEASAIWLHQVPGGLPAFCHSFGRRAIVMPCRIPATRCVFPAIFFKMSRLKTGG